MANTRTLQMYTCIIKSMGGSYFKYGTVNVKKKLNTGCVPKRPSQTAQIQIRLLLKSRLIRVFPICYSDRHYVSFNISFESREKRS